MFTMFNILSLVKENAFTDLEKFHMFRKSIDGLEQKCSCFYKIFMGLKKLYCDKKIKSE
jgi:hypothetical protein